MEENVVIESTSLTEIQARIYLVRGVQVMLDRDLAILYQVATKALNQAVKRNARRFPERFMFQLTKEEFENWKSQIVTSNIYSQEEMDALKMGSRRCPYAFTEQGISQLSAVLHSDIAVDVSVRIMDAFVAMRRFISANAGLFQRVDRLEQQQALTNERIDLVLDKIEDLSPAVTTEQLFATGCVWDAYTYVCDLIRSADTVHTRYTDQVKLDFEKHNKQYEAIDYVQIPQAVHDRYLIVDDNVWLLGASVKDMGHGLCTVIKLSLTPEQVLKLLK